MVQQRTYLITCWTAIVVSIRESRSLRQTLLIFLLSYLFTYLLIYSRVYRDDVTDGQTTTCEIIRVDLVFTRRHVTIVT